MGLVMLWLLPVLATALSMQFNWDLADFVIWSGMLWNVGLAYAFLARKSTQTAYQWGAGLALTAAFLLVWVTLAVGLIGSEDNPANLMFAGVLGIGLLGAIIARFHPRGMVWTMRAVAFVQTLAGGLAWMAGWGTEGASWPQDVLMGTVLFTGFWMGAAMQFR